MSKISQKAAQAIVQVINFHLEDYGLDKLQPARNMAIAIAADVKRIMVKELEVPNIEFGSSEYD